MPNVFSNRDKAILIELYLLKFDEDGLNAVGFAAEIQNPKTTKIIGLLKSIGTDNGTKMSRNI